MISRKILKLHLELLGKIRNFGDVTLASEDGNQIEVHEVILAALSTLFQNGLKRNKHAHPLICMRERISKMISWFGWRETLVLATGWSVKAGRLLGWWGCRGGTELS